MVEASIADGYKKCCDCGLILPLTEEYFLRYYSKRHNKYYYKCHCKECGKIRSKRWREENRERYKAYYTEQNQSTAGKMADRKYKTTHRAEIRDYKAIYRETHREEIAEYDRKKRATPEGAEHANAMTRRWRRNNKEAVAEYNRQYAQEHKDYFVQATQKRQARKKQLASTLTLAEWEAIKAEFEHKCAYCGKPLKCCTQDHFVPLTAGGAYSKGNIIPACRSCNSSKHNSSFEEWYRKQSYYSPEREQHILSFIGKQREGEQNGA